MRKVRKLVVMAAMVMLFTACMGMGVSAADKTLKAGKWTSGKGGAYIDIDKDGEAKRRTAKSSNNTAGFIGKSAGLAILLPLRGKDGLVAGMLEDMKKRSIGFSNQKALLRCIV